MPKELNLKGNVEVLVVNIGDKTFKIPLATSLPYKKAKTLVKLAKAWSGQTEKEGGQTLGE